MLASPRKTALLDSQARRFWDEVDCQLASLGEPESWSNEIFPRFNDGMTVNETAVAIAEARNEDRPCRDVNAEHRLTRSDLGVTR